MPDTQTIALTIAMPKVDDEMVTLIEFDKEGAPSFVYMTTQQASLLASGIQSAVTLIHLSRRAKAEYAPDAGDGEPA